jgi:hypothetical protein
MKIFFINSVESAEGYFNIVDIINLISNQIKQVS